MLSTGCSSTETDTTPPDAPLTLLATRGNGKVDLNWNLVTAEDLAGYYAYHRLEGGGPETKSELITRAYTTVTGLENGTTYIFYVTAADESGNESLPSPEVAATPNSEVSLTTAGWAAWELGDYAAAELLFNDALNFNADYADAYNGMGWSDLRQGEIESAVTRFEAAIDNGLTSQDAYVGALAVYRDIPGNLVIAMSYGLTIIGNDPQYVFSHDTTIDIDVVRLMLAQVFFRLGEDFFPNAQEQMDILVTGNGLDPADPSSWSVNGTDYPNYASALLALIQSAFSLLAG